MPVTDSGAGPGFDRDSPVVSILIAARNEERIIRDCLRAIRQLDYPPQAVEVLIGNDQSTDCTKAVVMEFIAQTPNFQLIDITEPVAALGGKANVLAQLARLARGKYLFFTDADTQVPAHWLSDMLMAFALPAGGAQLRPVGIVTGITLPDGIRLFHKLQTIDWLYNLTLTYFISSAGVAVTAMGNNMAVSRAAYQAVGGYESLPFSVVEDYTLFRAITGRGFGFQHLLDERVLARTKPVDTLRAFLHQRKRWMRGATTLPAWMVAALYGQYLLGPLLLLLGWFAPVPAVGLYLIHLFVQTTIISFGLGRLRQTRLWPYALLFELYQLLLGPLAVAFYGLPGRIEWKGRQYD